MLLIEDLRPRWVKIVDVCTRGHLQPPDAVYTFLKAPAITFPLATREQRPAISCAREQMPFGFAVKQDDAEQKSACYKDQITIQSPRFLSAIGILYSLRGHVRRKPR